MRLLERCERWTPTRYAGERSSRRAGRRSSSSTIDDVVLLASRRARQSIEGLAEGTTLPAGVLSGEQGLVPLVVPYDVGGRRERLVYLSREGDLTAYEELRSGFTAAVSHELRTPLARLLALARDGGASR